jgi:hypothetical protein
MSDEQIGAAILRASETVAAPAALRERLAAPAPRRRRVPRAPRLALGGALTAALVAFALLVTGTPPTVQQVAAAALGGPTAPAAGTAAEWSAVGRRSDQVAGRRAVTVIYRRGGAGIHYAILSGKPIAAPAGRTVSVGGRPYTLLRDGPTSIVTWRASGHTCVLASQQAGPDDLIGFLRAFYA